VLLTVRDDPYAVRAAINAGVRCYVVTPEDAGPGATTPVSRIRPRGGSPDELSAREVEVLQLVSEGRSNKDIGDALGLSALTVKSHLARIARKVGTGDRAEMVAHAMRAGLVR
jgi:DNA-binding NarL/FixJ family response regulator